MVSAIPGLGVNRGRPGQPGLIPGLPLGISLVLRAEQQDHLPLLSTEAGIKVMIHRRNHTPFLEHRGFSIRPGTETTIGVREVGPASGGGAQPWGLEGTVVGTEAAPSPQDEVHRLGSPYGPCTRGGQSGAVQLLYNASYTMQVSRRGRGAGRLGE